MLPELTTTGISIMSELPWRTHFCRFYETRAGKRKAAPRKTWTRRRKS